jgi:hypothetical protein
MNGRQAFNKDSVRTGDGQFKVAVIQQTSPEQTGVYLEVVAAQTVFDRDFPQAGGAEKQVVTRIFQQGDCLG